MKRLIKVQFRRRREHKTDYISRARSLKGGIPRLIVRRTNRYLVVQVVKSEGAQDMVVFNANSKELIKYGWPETASIKNLSAGYLLGALAAAKAKKAGIGKAILDIGLFKSTKGNRIYSVVKGAVDGGLEIPHSNEILPSMDRIEGKHIKSTLDVKKIMEQILK